MDDSLRLLSVLSDYWDDSVNMSDINWIETTRDNSAFYFSNINQKVENASFGWQRRQDRSKCVTMRISLLMVIDTMAFMQFSWEISIKQAFEIDQFFCCFGWNDEKCVNVCVMRSTGSFLRFKYWETSSPFGSFHFVLKAMCWNALNGIVCVRLLNLTNSIWFSVQNNVLFCVA